MRYIVRLLLFPSLAAALPAFADQTLARVQDWTVSGPDTLACTAPPALDMKGPGTLFEPANRVHLDSLSRQIAGKLQSRCPALREVIIVYGRSRRLLRLPDVSSEVQAASPAPVATETRPTATPAVDQPLRPEGRTAPAANPPVAAQTRTELLVAHYSNRKLASLESKRGADDKCELLLSWLGRVYQEYPETAGQRVLMPARAIALFRDEDFQQVFGQPYDQTTTKWRAETHEKVIARCQGASYTGFSLGGPQPGLGRRPGMTTYISQFEPFRQLLDGAFLSQPGPYSPAAISAILARAREGRASMDAILSSAGQDASPEGFRALSQSIQQVRSRLSVLWPAEQRFVTEALTARRESLAAAALDAWTGAIAASGTTLADVRRLTQEFSANRDLMAAAGPEQRIRAQTAYEARVDAILEPLVQDKINALKRLPRSLEGARQTQAWSSSFSADFRGYENRPPVAGAPPSYTSERKQILDAALPEWQKSLGSAEPTEAGLQTFARTLTEIFPAPQSDPSYAAWEAPLKAQRENKARADLLALAVQCDPLASYPSDPDAVEKGVPNNKLDAPAAIRACEAARKVAPEQPRLAFQLARGYLVTERYGDAAEQLLTAAKGGHGVSYAFLGDLYLDGAPGIDADPELARSFYERAVEAGFKPAAKILAEFEDVTSKFEEAEEEEKQYLAANPAAIEPEQPALPPPNTKFLNPEIVDNILQGNLDGVPFSERYTKLYLVNMAEEIAEMCEGAHFTKREVGDLKIEAALKSVDMSASGGAAVFMGTLMTLAQMTQNPETTMRRLAKAGNDTDNLWQEALKDAYALMTRYSCGTQPLEQFSKHAKAFINNQGAPRMSTDELMNVCVREARPTGPYKGKDFCGCFVGAVAMAPVTRAERKKLSSNFWPAAQAMKARKPDEYDPCFNGIGGRR